jgi:hypothetical protein
VDTPLYDAKVWVWRWAEGIYTKLNVIAVLCCVSNQPALLSNLKKSYNFCNRKAHGLKTANVAERVL